MYIIDELIKIIELFKNDIKKINKIKELIRENTSIIQKYSNNNKDLFILIEDLSNNFEEIYNTIKDDKKDKEYYDKLRYIYYKEIQKVSDINYRYKVFEKLIEADEMIKKSNNIFQLLLEDCIYFNEFEDTRNNIINGDKNIILKLIDDELKKDKFVLGESLLYFFEKCSSIYLKIILGSKDENDKIIRLEDEPLNVLKKSIQLLYFYIFKPDQLNGTLKELGKLFCLGYIKTYCNTFIKMFDESKPKCKEPNKIIDIFNGKDSKYKDSIYKMIRLYLYKVLYNNYKIDVFINKEYINKYILKDYIDFSELIENNKELSNIYKLDGKVKTINDDNYEKANKAIEKCKKEDFKNKIKNTIEDFGVDNFYVASYNFALSNIQMDNPDINEGFYNNVCKPLFKDSDILLSNAIKLFYDPKQYKKIKETESYKINQNNIKVLLFGYRFCLNEISLGNKRGIYYPLYTNNINFLKEKFYPGNDTKYNGVYSNIINHFRFKPDEGCFVCLCEGGFYHSVLSGFAGKEELDKKCPKCSASIGSVKDKNGDIKGVKRDKYFKICKDEKEIEGIIDDKTKYNKLKEINYMTIEEFKKKYINKSCEEERGVFKTDKNSFKKNDKIIRNLSQISYRLLNYILYTHLFFARLLTNKKDFDEYLPKGMYWADMLYECWNLLKNELLNENIDSIEKFMYYIFTDIFKKIKEKKTIDDYKSLIEIEEELETIIERKIRQYKDESNNPKNDDEDKTSFINLLKEKYIKDYYEKEEYPFYEYYYYTDYLNEKYISEKLNHIEKNKYPVLENYLEYNENKIDEKDNKYSLNNLNLFNSTLNLINEEYFNNISRDDAEKKQLKDDEIYINNKELIDDFIEFYNNLKIDDNGTIIKISNKNSLCDFFLDNDNVIGRSYQKIYFEFIKEQNKKIEKLLDMKIEKGIFDINCKTEISIQKINENEIFNYNLPTKHSIMDIFFNASYRKILDSNTRSYELYNEYEINYDFIEENMTDLFLKNKKLINKEITYFIYNNETFSHQLKDLITLFKKRYNNKNLLIDDKVVIYKFAEDNKNSTDVCKKLINDFIVLITFLSSKRKEGINKMDNINEELTISEILDKIKDQISPFFGKLFEKNESLTIDKTSAIFDYYLKCIYDNAKNELKKYQEELDDNSKELIKNYYKTEHLIKKNDLAYAIRLFIILVLLPEEDKEKKIKTNRNNLINYLKAVDLWEKDICENEGFIKNLNELKLIGAQIKHSISLYEYLGKDIDKKFFDDVKEKIKQRKPVADVGDVDDEGFRKKKQIDDDEDDESIKKRKKKGDEDDEDEDDESIQKRKKKGDEDDEDDEDDPFGRKKKGINSDDEDDPFGRKKKGINSDEDEN